MIFKLTSPSKRRRAAEYVRMSTEQQKYSIDNQRQAIAEFAALHNIEIVRTYADEGKSGILIKGRDALRQLISDVQSGTANYEMVLVYDVSRWGRFQDADESAYYEFMCRSAGIYVEYCAEQFKNDGTMYATLVKSIKRVMAAEYSRELSAKIFRAHHRLASLGLHQGGRPNYGLRRLLVDENRQPKFLLADGQRKSQHTDRVVLVPGPPNEVRVVRDIFRLYVNQRASIREIIRTLTEKGVRNARGNSWSIQNITDILSCEKYAGTFVYNCSSERMRKRRVYFPPGKWLRVENAIEPIIDMDTFAEARCRLSEGWTLSEVDMLNYLTATWCTTGYVAVKNLGLNKCGPSQTCYIEHFGCLRNAYRKIGFRPSHRYRYEEIGDFLRQVDRQLISRLTSLEECRKGLLRYDYKSHIFIIDGVIKVRTLIIPYIDRENRGPGWRIFKRYVSRSDLLLVARLRKSNKEILDYFLLPYPEAPTFRFASNIIPKLVRYRLKSLARFYSLATRLAPQLSELRLPMPTASRRSNLRRHTTRDQGAERFDG